MSLTILKASAGSGKTYALTLQYLKLLLSGDDPDYFRKILAVTFTNKATREMKERILSELRKVAAGKMDKGMGLDLKNALNVSEQVLQQRAQNALQAILHNYSHFSVSTNDSFFQKVIRNFAREEGLPANYKVELNTDKVLEVLTDQLLERAETDLGLHNWLVDYAGQKMEDGKSWNIRYELISFAKEMFKEGFVENAQQVNAPQTFIQNFKSFQQSLFNEKNQFEDEMHQLGQQAIDFIQNEGLSLEDFNGGAPRSVAFQFRKALKTEKKYEITDTFKNVLNENEKTNWYSAAKRNLIKPHVPKLDDFGQQLLNYHERHFTTYQTVVLILSNSTSFALIGYYLELLEEYRKDENTLLISDISRLLNGIIADDEVPFIYEKTGNRYQHFLIDEFQDTSRQHWENFRPLLTNSLSTGQECLIVGDPKQSIYRWRGGDMNLMQHQVKQDIQAWSKSVLEHNWRSCPKIIDFNNTFFPNAAGIVHNELKSSATDGLPQQEKNEIEDLISNVESVYREATQAFPEVKKEQAVRPGYVLIQATQHSNEISFKRRAQQLLLQNLDRMLENGYQLFDIAVLTRKNKQALEIAEFLSAHQYDVLSEDALLIKSSAGVRLIVNVLRYLYNFNDKPALAAATHLYLKEVQNIEDSRLAQIDWKDFKSLKEHLPEAFTSKNVELGSMPLYELCSRLYRVFALDTLADEQHHLHAFLDQVHHYSHEQEGDLGSFIYWWAEEGVEKSLKREQAPNAIRLLTLHKSKGLQFPVVLIPYCNWKFMPKSGQILWASTQDSNGHYKHSSLQPLGNMTVPISFSSDMENTAFRADYYMEYCQSYLDNLNLLYVALTRAEEVLMITFQKPGDKSESKHTGWLMQQYFKGEDAKKEEAEIEDIAFDYEVREFGELSAASARTHVQDDEPDQPHQPMENWNQVLRLRRHARPLHLLQNDESAQKVDYGDRVHQVLEEVKYADELEAVLEKQKMRGELAADDAELLKNKLDHLLNDERIAPWFSRDWTEVLNEQPIQDSEGNIFRPDRILLDGEQAIVIDYKTGQKRDSHREQVQNYMRLLQELGYDDVQGYLLYLEQEHEFVEEVNL